MEVLTEELPQERFQNGYSIYWMERLLKQNREWKENMDKVLCLLYHRINPVEDDIYQLTVSPENFEEQVRFLKDNFQYFVLRRTGQRGVGAVLLSRLTTGMRITMNMHCHIGEVSGSRDHFCFYGLCRCRSGILVG